MTRSDAIWRVRENSLRALKPPPRLPLSKWIERHLRLAGNRPAIVRSSMKAAPLFLIGVDGLKAQILTRLARGRTIRFSQSLEPVYFEQVASERRVVRYVRGQPFRRFERIPGKRAEALDCLVYGLAARQLVVVNLDRREAELASAGALPSAMPPVVRSKWMTKRPGSR